IPSLSFGYSVLLVLVDFLGRTGTFWAGALCWAKPVWVCRGAPAEGLRAHSALAPPCTAGNAPTAAVSGGTRTSHRGAIAAIANAFATTASGERFPLALPPESDAVRDCLHSAFPWPLAPCSSQILYRNVALTAVGGVVLPANEFTT